MIGVIQLPWSTLVERALVGPAMLGRMRLRAVGLGLAGSCRMCAMVFALIILALASAPAVAQKPTDQSSCEDATSCPQDAAAASRNADEAARKLDHSGMQLQWDSPFHDRNSIKSVLSDLHDSHFEAKSLFPEVGAKLLAPYYRFRDNLQIFKLNFSSDYSTLIQHASSTLSDEDVAASQVFRVLGTWLHIGERTGAHGWLVWKGEYRGALGSKPTPRDMGFDTGSALSSANYKQLGWGVTDLYWEQRFEGDTLTMKVGHMDPGDWADQHPLLDAWKRYLSDAYYNNPTQAIPKRGFGVVAQYYLTEHLFLAAGVHDANGKDGRLDFESFWDTREWMNWIEFGYRGERDITRGENFQVQIWEQDARKEEGTQRSKGITITYSNEFANGTIPFVRAGYSEGDAPQMRRFIGAGIAFPMFDRDTLGVATSWGSPPDSSLRDQVTSEVFYRTQVTRNISLTPSLQLYYQPSYNPEKDWISVIGLRFRLVF